MKSVKYGTFFEYHKPYFRTNEYILKAQPKYFISFLTQFIAISRLEFDFVVEKIFNNKFNGENLVSPGYVTVIHNGVVVQNHTEIQGTTEWIGAPKYKAHGCAPLQLQDHGNLVSFKNMWVRPL